MGLEPKVGKVAIRKIVTFDFEWMPEKGSPKKSDGSDIYNARQTGLDLRLCGIFDGRSYRHFFKIGDFLNHVLTRRYENVWMYAHAGGLADITFILEEIITRGGQFEVEASFSGSSAIIVRVKKGKHQWVFIDSYWTLRDKLANIAKMVGMEKGEVDFETTNMGELIKYNEQDCVILWHALDTFETGILDLGGQLNMTQASTALELFRRRFLKAPIRTNDNVNEVARRSYFASRVEVIRDSCEDALYYDINSSFPHAMTFEAPGSITKTSSKKLPDRGLYLAKLRVSVPDMYLPPLPFRPEEGGSVYFPIGVWDGWFMNTDVELLLREGGDILRVGEVVHFEPFNDLAEYARTLYEKRMRSSSDAEKVIVKILLNSLYGKFAETTIKSKMLIYPSSTGCQHEPKHGADPEYPLLPACMEQLFPGVYLVHSEVDAPHVHVPISSHITAIARRSLYNYMKGAAPYYYCDTDSIVTRKEQFDSDGSLITSKSKTLGGLKLERVIKSGRFLLPKAYTIEHEPDAKTGDTRTTRVKGFTLGDKRLLGAAGINESEHNYKQFIRLSEGREIEFRRMSRVREMFRSGIAAPYDQVIKKRLQHVARRKRASIGKGDSRPWTIEELTV